MQSKCSAYITKDNIYCMLLLVFFVFSNDNFFIIRWLPCRKMPTQPAQAHIHSMALRDKSEFGAAQFIFGFQRASLMGVDQNGKLVSHWLWLYVSCPQATATCSYNSDIINSNTSRHDLQWKALCDASFTEAYQKIKGYHRNALLLKKIWFS